MHTILIYTLSYAAVVVFIILWRAYQLLTLKARERLFSIFSKWAFYTIIVPRQKGSSDVSVIAGCLILLMFMGNIAGSIVAIRNRTELSIRLARLFAINLTVLFVGGRSSFIIDKILRWPMAEYYLFHRWVGRISILEALVHGILQSAESRSSLSKMNVAVSACPHPVYDICLFH